jgi:hypothetical protein
MRIIAALGSAVIVLACAQAEPAPYLLRDSLGVVIAEGASELEWTVEHSALWSIGAQDGDASEVFHQVVAAQLLPSGEVVVADQGSRAVRIYESGVLRRTLGTEGAGPFEFRRIDKLGLLGDSIVVYDANHSRFSFWTMSGMPVREFQIDPGLMIEAIQPEGGFIAVGGTHLSEYETSGTFEHVASIFKLDRRGQRVDSLTALPFSERLVRTDGRSTAAFALPFGRFGLLVADDEGFCYAYGFIIEVRCFSNDGRLVSLTRVSATPREISDEQKRDFAEWFASFVADPVGKDAVRKRFTDQWTHPRYSPAIASLVMDRLGCVWAEEYWRPRLGSDDWYAKEAQGNGRWIVLTRSGLPLATVTIPTAFTPTDIAEDVMLGIWRDSLGVQTIRGLGLKRDGVGATAGYCA